MSQQEMMLIFPLLMLLFGGPVLALVMKAPFARKTFEKRKTQFAQGKLKRDPGRDLVGAHRSFLRNMLVGGVMFGFLGLAIMAGMRLAG